MIDRTAVLAQYDREMRQDPPETSGATFEREGTLVRERHEGDIIVFSNLTSATAPGAVGAEANRARSLGRELEWKVYDHDRPPELPTLLEHAGFRPDEPETLVVLDLEDRSGNGTIPPGISVREVEDVGTFQDALVVSEAAFGPTGTATLERFRTRLSDPTARLFVAYLGEHPVSAGRLELPPGRAFASLWGGGTVPEARHRGAYRALVHSRAERARRSGYRFLTVDARASSRPILKRLGFVALSGIQGWLQPGPSLPG